MCIRDSFIGVYNAGAALFRAQGNSKISMLSSLVMNVVNIGGNAVLIYGFGMGVMGAALASLVSRAIACAVVLYLLQKPGCALRVDSLRAMAAQKLTAQANEWLADNDQTDREAEKDPITEDEFARRILLTEFTVSPGGRFTAWYEDDDMFWGHVITVDGTLKKGPVDAEIQG